MVEHNPINQFNVAEYYQSYLANRQVLQKQVNESVKKCGTVPGE